jgi:hypothetical protein
MITQLPDPETTRHIEPQPPTPFQFLWDVLFSSRKKLKLTLEDVTEMISLDHQIDPWRKALMLLDTNRINPQGRFDDAVNALAHNPTEHNVDRILLLRWTPPFSSLQLNNAAAIIEGVIAEKCLAVFPPVVRRHLERIRKALESELALQLAADLKAMARLDGAAVGGESAAARTLRQRCLEVEKQLEGSDSHLCDWRTILGPYLP